MCSTSPSAFNRLLASPLRASAISTLVSLAFASVINLLFLTPQTLPTTLIITFLIAAPMSYLTIRLVIALRVTIETQKVKLALEHERAYILAKFLRDAAHEFKTPLTLMSSSLYLLEKTTDPDKKKQYVHQTLAEIDGLNTLLESILLLTRLDSTDKSSYSRDLVKITGFVTDLRSFSSRPRVKLNIENADLTADVSLNSPDMHLAVKQFIDNALRYSPLTGDVELRIETSGQWLTIAISDSGQGIPDEILPHIFDRFFRSDESHTTRGLGLGLPIAKRIVELHDGHIEIQSTVTKGTTITVFLPLIRL